MRACMLAYTFYENDNRVRRYAETLARRGDCVDVVALNRGGLPDSEVIRGVTVYRIQNRVKDEKGKLTYLGRLFRFLVRSGAFVSRRHLGTPYDLIHVHSVPDFEVFSAAVPRIAGAKVILDIHDIVPEFYASKFGAGKNSLVFRLLLLMERLSAGFADHVIVANHIWQERLIERSVPSRKCSAILNYPDPEVFYPRPRKRSDGKFIAIYPGTVNWHQGLDVAVRAFARVKERLPEAEFHIYGDLGDKSLPGLVKELGLEGTVLFRECLPLDRIADVMAESDMGIVPKRNDPFGGDAFSTKILEFMALGVPVVVSRTRVDSRYFDDSTVKFFRPEDDADLAASIIEMAENRELRRRIAGNASAFVAGFGWERKKGEYLGLVDSLVAGGTA